MLNLNFNYDYGTNSNRYPINVIPRGKQRRLHGTVETNDIPIHEPRDIEEQTWLCKYEKGCITSYPEDLKEFRDHCKNVIVCIGRYGFFFSTVENLVTPVVPETGILKISRRGWYKVLLH